MADAPDTPEERETAADNSVAIASAAPVKERDPPAGPTVDAAAPVDDDEWDLDDRRDLRSRTIRGGALTMLGQGLKLILTVTSTAALARLLPPEDFGLMGMVSVVVGFLIAVGDMGLSIAIVQREELRRREVDKLFWIGLYLQIALAVLTAISAPLLGSLFGEAAVVPMTVAMSFGFVVVGLGMTHLALLRRRMRFGRVAAIELGSLALGIAVGIAGAAMGFGAWSLVAMYLVQRSAETVAAWLASGWRPRRAKRDVSVAPLLRFGGYHTGFAFVNYFARNSDNLLIGWFWGAGPLGFYTRAYGLLMMPIVQLNVPISGVTLPALSRLQNDAERFRHVYLRAIGLLATLGLPLITFTIVAAPDIIAVFLGPQWHEVVPVFRILGLVGLAQLITNTAGMLYVASGRTDRMFRIGIWCTLATVGCFVLALPHGIESVALCYAAYTWLAAVPILSHASRGSSITVADIMKTIARPAMCACLIASVLVLVTPALQTMSPFLRVSVLTVASGATWFAFLRLFARDLDPLRLFREMKRKPA